MTPELFVKKWGLTGFKIAASLGHFYRYKYTIFYSDEIDFSNEFNEKHKNYMFESKNIKRIIDSHNLIEKLGGIDLATKAALNEECKARKRAILRAIRDVTACK